MPPVKGQGKIVLTEAEVLDSFETDNEVTGHEGGATCDTQRPRSTTHFETGK